MYILTAHDVVHGELHVRAVAVVGEKGLRLSVWYAGQNGPHKQIARAANGPMVDFVTFIIPLRRQCCACNMNILYEHTIWTYYINILYVHTICVYLAAHCLGP